MEPMEPPLDPPLERKLMRQWLFLVTEANCTLDTQKGS